MKKVAFAVVSKWRNNSMQLDLKSALDVLEEKKRFCTAARRKFKFSNLKVLLRETVSEFLDVYFLLSLFFFFFNEDRAKLVFSFFSFFA